MTRQASPAASCRSWRTLGFTSHAMNSQEFFNQFIGLYRQARIPTFADDSIRRDRCRSVSGGLEDLLAFFIAKNIPGKYRIYVDQHLNLGKRLAMYPDIVLLSRESDQVKHFIDAKTDLGWNRDKLEFMCEKLFDQAEASKRVAVKLVGHTGEVGEHRVAVDAKCHLVIGTRVNSGNLDASRVAEVERKTGVAIYVLSESKHPNLFSKGAESVYPESCIAQDAIDRLLGALR